MLLSIIESPSDTQELTNAATRFSWTWDASEAMTWLLVRTPGIGLMISGIPPPWYMYKQDSSGVGDPTFILTFSSSRAHLMAHTLRAY